MDDDDPVLGYEAGGEAFAYPINILNFHGIRLYIDEAIFSALQDLGWLHPYVLHYHWVVITDKHGMVLKS